MFLALAIGGAALTTVSAPDAFAASASKAAVQKVPTTINANKMEYDANAQTIVFLGKVHVTRTDFELWSEKMTVYLDKTKRKASGEETEAMSPGELDRIVAEQNVRMKSEDKAGTCQKAIYYAKEDKFVMEGKPVLRDGKSNTVFGKTLVHYPSTGISQALGGGGITFYAPDSKEKGGRSSGGKR